MAPYLGLGWGNAVNTIGSKWSFSSDFGVLFQGSPEIKLTANGEAKDLASNQTIKIDTDTVFQAELEKQTRKTNKDAKDFKFYPVISMGASYRF